MKRSIIQRAHQLLRSILIQDSASLRTFLSLYESLLHVFLYTIFSIHFTSVSMTTYCIAITVNNVHGFLCCLWVSLTLSLAFVHLRDLLLCLYKWHWIVKFCCAIRCIWSGIWLFWNSVALICLNKIILLYFCLFLYMGCSSILLKNTNFLLKVYSNIILPLSSCLSNWLLP